MYDIKIVSKRVEKEIKQLGEEEKEQFIKVIKLLRENPCPLHFDCMAVNRCTSIKRLKAKRLRVFYLIDEKNRTVRIGKVGHRESHSYGVDIKSWFK
ncbi:type II toxin-antitoxin system RelE family toxin [Paenibacillus roseipurpureus]|uniref:Type II toxin-antitoxin system RelE/ParE family toxin n=1 Tax=Paenibacillus roseopurpureus TaxID=2918901 RepID=A0AA96LNQ4_9BACL|nr:type II toxin-antitoxin system RelE/ParE family toxin [Paenibacillus sp. MBLB1832]WNR45120.1 type II toxin-antitoxin system RelE/ParE family toxin [Paenibacillus sp. MBLB1832]